MDGARHAVWPGRGGDRCRPNPNRSTGTSTAASASRFRSNQERGRPRQRGELHDDWEYAGLSVFRTFEAAAAKTRELNGTLAGTSPESASRRARA